jgi:dynein heavy chain
VQFSSLDKIEIGGTKGKILSKSVVQIHKEFTDAVTQFSKINYDIMNIACSKFDQDFYNFRSRVKELERRLGSILTQGFDDADTIFGRFKLLDSFEGLLNRPIIQDELEKKHSILLESYKLDLKAVQAIFIETKPSVDRNDDTAPIPLNYPPIAGAIVWSRGLLERIEYPYEKLKQLHNQIQEKDE